MTLETDDFIVTHDGDGVTVLFPYDKPFDAPEDLRALILRVDGTLFAPTLNATGDSGGGTVEITSGAPAVGEKVTLYRDTALLQLVDYSSGDFPSELHERLADRMTMVAQERKAQERRSLRFSPLTPEFGEIAPIQDGTALMWKDGTVKGGPTASEIAQAQGYAEDALQARNVATAARETATEQAGVAKDQAQAATDQAQAAATSASEAAGKVPLGTVMWFTAPIPPAGWLAVDGSAVTPLYPDLRALLIDDGSRWGTDANGDPYLPNLLAEFIRGWDGGRGVDAGREFGSWQEDALQGHGHTVRGGNVSSPSTPNVSYRGNQGAFDVPTNGYTDDGVNGTPRIEAETRPRSVALLPCIKAFGVVTVEGMADLSELLNAIATPEAARAGVGGTDLMTPELTAAAIEAQTELPIAVYDLAGLTFLDFNQFDAGKYSSYEFVFENALPELSGETLRARTSNDGGI
ncbi:phage tail protein, partial [uncultured Ruegeria sp.]